MLRIITKLVLITLLLQFELVTESDLILEVVTTDVIGMLQTQLFKHFTYYS